MRDLNIFEVPRNLSAIWCIYKFSTNQIAGTPYSLCVVVPKDSFDCNYATGLFEPPINAHYHMLDVLVDRAGLCRQVAQYATPSMEKIMHAWIFLPVNPKNLLIFWRFFYSCSISRSFHSLFSQACKFLPLWCHNYVIMTSWLWCHKGEELKNQSKEIQHFLTSFNDENSYFKVSKYLLIGTILGQV